jgi:hypothetical protein
MYESSAIFGMMAGPKGLGPGDWEHMIIPETATTVFQHHPTTSSAP